MRKFILAADHGGYALKQKMLAKLKALHPEMEFCDAGCNEGEVVDYPDLAKLACERMLNGEFETAILFCGTGIGISIAANKLAGVRCAHVTDCYSAAKAKQHNNANAIALGGRITGEDLALEIINSYLGAEFEGGRHAERVELLMSFENENGAVKGIACCEDKITGHCC